MKPKTIGYAAVGAPIVALKAAQEKLDAALKVLSSKTGKLSSSAEKTLKTWAAEGEKVVEKFAETGEEAISKIDLEQAKAQISKVRDQIEELISNLKSGVQSDDKDKEPEAKKPAAKKPAAKKPAAKKPETVLPAPTSVSETAGPEV